jgi:hypothetical protein
MPKLFVEPKDKEEDTTVPFDKGGQIMHIICGHLVCWDIVE